MERIIIRNIVWTSVEDGEKNEHEAMVAGNTYRVYSDTSGSKFVLRKDGDLYWGSTLDAGTLMEALKEASRDLT